MSRIYSPRSRTFRLFGACGAAGGAAAGGAAAGGAAAGGAAAAGASAAILYRDVLKISTPFSGYLF